MQVTGFPTTDDTIESIFFKELQTLVAKFLSFQSSNSTHTPKSLRESLTRDCRAAIESQKALNALAIDKKKAMDEAEEQRKKRERENAESRKKEAQILGEFELFHGTTRNSHAMAGN